MAKNSANGKKHGRKSVAGKSSPKPTKAKSPVAKGGTSYPSK